MDRKPPRLAALMWFAFVLGVIGFGGGYAIAQRLRRALVDERGWLDEADFVESLSVAGSLPGTMAANLMTVVGHRFAGISGSLGAVLAFLAPSVALMMAFGATYERLRGLGGIASLLDGMGVATAGVVAAVAVDMRSGAKGRIGWVIAIATTLALASRALNLLEVVALAGIVGAIALRPDDRTGRPPTRSDPDPKPPSGLFALAPAVVLGATPLFALFVVFARIGIATFGGGISMIGPIEHEVVQVHGWLTESAFNDAIVLGQITPGPISIAATFIGYRVGGPLGAIAATVGMFGPPFVLGTIAARSLPAFRSNAVVRGFLAGVAPAVVGAIAAAGIALVRTAVHSWWQACVALVAFGLLVARPKMPAIVLIVGGGVVEVIVRAL